MSFGDCGYRGGKSVHGVRKVFPRRRDSDSGKSIFVSCTCVFVPASDYIFSRGLNRKNIRREQIFHFIIVVCNCVHDVKRTKILFQNFIHVYIYYMHNDIAAEILRCYRIMHDFTRDMHLLTKIKLLKIANIKSFRR